MKDSEFAGKMINLVAGVASLSKQKIEEMAKEMSEKSGLTQDEGKKFIEEMLDKYKGAKEDFETKVEDIAKGVYEKMNLATVDQVKELEDRVKALEKKHK